MITLQALLIAAAVMAADSSHTASTDSIPSYRLPEIVVTAKRVRTPVETLALSVSTIATRDIELSSVNSSTDLAGSLPGVFIQRTGSFGRSDVNIRGLGSRGRRAVVLVDGRPERMALFDCTVTHSFLLHDVDRIEVIRGPASVLYGSGAMGGVLNVISPKIVRDFDLDLEAGAGSHGTTVTTGRAGKSWNRLAGSVSLDYRSSDGHVPNSAYEGFDGAGRAALDVGGGAELTLSLHYFDGYKEEPLRMTDSPDQISDTWNDYKRGSVDLLLGGVKGGAAYEARYYRTFGEHEFRDGWHSKDATDGVILHITGRPMRRIEIASGADFRLQGGKRLDDVEGEWDKWEGGIYATADYTLTDHIVLTGGGRYNRDEFAGEQLCPSVGVVAVPRDGTALRASAAKAFRTPQLNELFMYPISNEDLGAETLWSYEVGLKQRLFGFLTLDLTGFHMDGEDLIEVLPNDLPPPLYIFQNGGSYEFTGFEMSLDCYMPEWFFGRISYSYMDTGRWTRGRPGSKLDLSLTLELSHFSVRVTGTRVDDYYASNEWLDRIDPYGVFGLFAETAPRAGMRLFAGVDNIFDEPYAIFVDLPGGDAGLYCMPGRNFIAGLRYGL